MPSCPRDPNATFDVYPEAPETWIQSVLRIIEEEETLTDQEREDARHILRRASESLEDSPGR